MIQRVVTGSSRLRKYVPMGTPTSAPNTITAVALRSAFFHALGTGGAAAMKSMMSSSAATSLGAAILLASGMKISAEPKPENPRAVPETKAIAQIAIAALTLTSVGMRPSGLMRYFWRMICPKTASHFSGSCAQRAAGLLRHVGDDLRRHRVDFLVGHGLFARLDRHRDRDRFLAVVDALAFIDVEYADIGDQLLVDALRGAHDVAGLDAAVDDEGKIARHRLERGKFEQRFGARRLLLRLGYAIEDHLESHQRSIGTERLERPGTQLAAIAEHV